MEKENPLLTYIILSACILFLIFWYMIDTDIIPNITTAETKQLNKTKVIGTWLWKNPDEISKAGTLKLLDFAAENDINTVYVSIDKYIYLHELKEGDEKDKKLESFNSSVGYFIRESNKRGIKVEALIGNNRWSEENLSYIPQVVLEYIKDYNNLNPEAKFAGLQLDIEFYNKEGLKDPVKEGMEFLTLLKNLTDKIKELKSAKENKDFRFGTTVPLWFDEKSQSIPIEGGSAKPILYHIFDILNETEDSYIVIMAYRNFTSGWNGSISISEKEVDYSSKENLKVKVIVGQETAENEVKKITYFGKSKSSFLASLNRIIKHFEGYSGFEGIAIHHLESFSKMR